MSKSDYNFYYNFYCQGKIQQVVLHRDKAIFLIIILKVNDQFFVIKIPKNILCPEQITGLKQGKKIYIKGHLENKEKESCFIADKVVLRDYNWYRKTTKEEAKKWNRQHYLKLKKQQYYKEYYLKNREHILAYQKKRNEQRKGEKKMLTKWTKLEEKP